jgi:hypothetical protein
MLAELDRASPKGVFIMANLKKTVPPAAPARTSSTPVRNTSIPKAQPKAVTYEMIAKRAYEISRSPQGGSEFDNWIRAERELRGQ